MATRFLVVRTAASTASVQHYKVVDASSASSLSYGAFAAALAIDEVLQDAMSGALSSSGFAGYHFESVPVTGAASSAVPYEFVLASSSSVARLTRADHKTFGSKFRAAKKPGAGAVCFTNLGGDATLCAPMPSSTMPPNSFAHAASFFSAASSAESRPLWSSVGSALLHHFEAAPLRPVWLSTAGLGVSYLHVRLDSSPKYYVYTPFKDASSLLSMATSTSTTP